jgi:hypothetical protein
MCPDPRPPDPVVLVACDGGPDGDAALRYAVDRAAESRAGLLVVARYDGPAEARTVREDSAHRMRARRRTEKALRRALGDDPVHLACRVVVATNSTARSVIAHSTSAIMIVVACHDRETVQDLFRHLASAVGPSPSPVPIAVVPARHGQVRQGSP